MKSKKKPLVAAAISALLALAGSVSAQNTGGTTKHTGAKRARVHARSGKKATKVRAGKKSTKHLRRSTSGKKATKHYRRRGGKKGKKSSGGTTTQAPK